MQERMEKYRGGSIPKPSLVPAVQRHSFSWQELLSCYRLTSLIGVTNAPQLVDAGTLLDSLAPVEDAYELVRHMDAVGISRRGHLETFAAFGETIRAAAVLVGAYAGEVVDGKVVLLTEGMNDDALVYHFHFLIPQYRHQDEDRQAKRDHCADAVSPVGSRQKQPGQHPE